MQEIHLPDSITRIREETFAHCLSLQKIHLPDGITEIGENIFKDCKSLQDIAFRDIKFHLDTSFTNSQLENIISIIRKQISKNM